MDKHIWEIIPLNDIYEPVSMWLKVLVLDKPDNNAFVRILCFPDKHWLINSENNQHIEGLVRDCSKSSARAMELLQSCTNPSINATLCKKRGKHESEFCSHYTNY